MGNIMSDTTPVTDGGRICSGTLRTRRNFTKAAVKTAAAGAAALTVANAPKQAAAACFLKGTRIRTAAGECNVEDLTIGDVLPTASCGSQIVQLIGSYNFFKDDPEKSWAEGLRPVRISRSALSDGVPYRDLYLSQYHSLLIDGVLVTAGTLTNGTTIVQVDPRELQELAYFHIKLARHDVVFAEGAPCESLLKMDENADNFSEYVRRYGQPAVEEHPYAPVLAFNGTRSEVASRIRSAISPWFDIRRPLDVIRDRIEERGLAMVSAGP
jgi:Hint domain